jgi:hypothetical protein
LFKKIHKGVKGFVFDSETKKPISNATIEVEGNTNILKTYLDGDYWRLLAPGVYKLIVKYPGYTPKEAIVKVGSGSAQIVDFELEPMSGQFNRLVDNFSTIVSSNTNFLLLAGIIALFVSSILMTIGCYYKYSIDKRQRSPTRNKPSKLFNNVGFHRYNELTGENSDDETKTSTRYSNKAVRSDNVRLLNGRISEDESGAEENDIFVR